MIGRTRFIAPFWWLSFLSQNTVNAQQSEIFTEILVEKPQTFVTLLLDEPPEVEHHHNHTFIKIFSHGYLN